MPRLLHDMEAAIDRIGCPDLYRDIARAFGVSLPETEQALVAAMDGKDWETARRLAHSLKSNCATMGAENLRGELANLEKACALADEAEAQSLLPPVREALQALQDELLTLP